MEYNDSLKAAAAKAAAQLESRLNKKTTSVLDATEVTLEKVQDVGGMNSSAIAAGEIAEFLPAEMYKDHLGELVQITETRSTNGQTYQNLYAFATIYRRINNKLNRVGDRMVNVGGLLRRHFDMSDAVKGEGDKMIGAQRIVTPGTFNEDMQSYGNPWNVLTNYLAGKKIEGDRTKEKHHYQKFVNRQPVADEYILQYGIEYSFTK